MSSTRPYRSAEELVYDHLRGVILGGKFPPYATRVRRDVAELREIVGPYIRVNGVAQQSAELAQDRHDSLLMVLESRLRRKKYLRAAFAMPEGNSSKR